MLVRCRSDHSGFLFKVKMKEGHNKETGVGKGKTGIKDVDEDTGVACLVIISAPCN